MPTEAQKRARNKYNSTLKTIVIRIKPELYENIANAAKDSGLSVRAFILKAIDEKIGRMQDMTRSHENSSSGEISAP